MPKRRNADLDPVKVHKRTYRNGRVVWIIRYYPTGVVTTAAERVTWEGTFDARPEAEEVAEELRRTLMAHVDANRTDIPPYRRLLKSAVARYEGQIERDTTIAEGTRKNIPSRLRVGLGGTPALERPCRALPQYAQAVLEAVDRSMTKANKVQPSKPKGDVTKSGIRTALANFGEWLEANGYLDGAPNPFAPDKELTKDRIATRRGLRRIQATERAQSAELVGDDGDSDVGIGLKDVPGTAVVIALRNAVIRSASGVTRKQTGPGSRGGAAPLTIDVAAVLAETVLVRAFAGLRTCEALALHASRISADGHEIKVDRQLNRYKKWESGVTPEAMMAPPKYDKTRDAVVWPDYVDRLLELRERAIATSGGWIYPRSRNQLQWVVAYEAMINKAITDMNNEHAAGCLDPGTGQAVPGWEWAPHFLRHCYGSWSLASRPIGGLGWSLQLVSQSMGHASTRTTEGIYVHPTQTEREIIRGRRIGIAGL